MAHPLPTKSLKAHFQNRHSLLGAGPDADWEVIFLAFALLLLLVLASGLFIFVGVERGGLFTTSQLEQIQPTTLNTSLLKKTISYYEAKASALEKIKSGNETVVDPSRQSP